MSTLSGMNGSTDRVLEQIMDFIETAQYNAPSPTASSSVAIPEGWRRCHHPNGDIYYFHDELRLITPEDITDPDMHEYVLDAQDDLIECIEQDPNFHILPDDYEMVISEVTPELATCMIYSRTSTEAYKWTEDTGLVVKTREQFWSYVAEFPSHHDNLPPGTENECALAIREAVLAAENGAVFHFSDKILLINSKYEFLRTLRDAGIDISPTLAWLVGVLMPLDSTDTRGEEQQQSGS